MSKTQIVIGSVLLSVLIILIIVLSILVSGRTTNNSVVPLKNPTPTLFQPSSRPDQLKVISVSPFEGQTDVILKPAITITFNKKITTQDVEFSIMPAFQFTQEIRGNKLNIYPKLNLTPGTLYTFIVKYPLINESSTTFRFVTTGPTQQFLPDTRPPGMEEEEKQNQLSTAPDVYAANLLPYSSIEFDAQSEYIAGTPEGHFRINVVLKVQDKEVARNSFINWLKSEGMNDSHLSQLDIVYR